MKRTVHNDQKGKNGEWQNKQGIFLRLQLNGAAMNDDLGPKH